MAKGRTGNSRAKAFRRREQTIIPELKRRGRTGEFVDRRFGEASTTISRDEKMQERFSKERLRISKKKMRYNLNQDENNDDYSHTLTLTHRGKQLTEDAMDSDPNSEDDDDYGFERDTFRENDSLHQSITDSTYKKSKGEIMQEIIAKSKRARIERQKTKEENEALREDIDASLNTFLSTGLIQPRQPGTARDEEEKYSRENPDPYRQAMRALTFERRAQPSDPQKSQEEVKAAKAAKLKKLEEELDESENDDTDKDDKDDGELDPVERSLQLVRDNANKLILEIVACTDLDRANAAYQELAALCVTRSVRPVAEVFRMKISSLAKQALETIKAGEKPPCIPEKDVLVLLYLALTIFPRRSDQKQKKHPVATLVVTLITSLLSIGRLLRPRHVLGALFMAQMLLEYVSETRKIVNEAFGILYPLLRLAICNIDGGQQQQQIIPFPKTRTMTKSLNDFFVDSSVTLTKIEPMPITFSEVMMMNQDDSISKAQLVSHMLHIVRRIFILYSTHHCAVMILTPFLNLTVQWPSLHDELASILPGQSPAIHPALVKPKPIAIPSLEPDFGRDQTSKEAREQKHLERLYKKEYRGAKRELGRDSAFLAQKKLEARLKDDQKYQERLRSILGSIANESATPKPTFRGKRKF